MTAKLNNRLVDQITGGTHIVLEAGPTHNGIESAKKLVDLAVKAGADSIKFQTLYADRLMADKNIEFEYSYLEIENGEEKFIPITEKLYDILKRRELSKESWRELKAYCDAKEIHMFSTATYRDEVDFLVDELGIDSIKINSGDVTDIEFIEYCATKKVNLQLDTGNADIWEIERAVIAAEEKGCTNIIIHLCPSGYPTRLESIHLHMLKTLKQMFPNYSVAFSDHSPGWDIDIAAVALGADMIEKTITLDRKTRSCEHSFSLEEEDAIAFINSIRNVEKALGNSRRVIPANIREKRKAGRRSPYALKKIPNGSEIKLSDFEFKRPGFGITSEEFNLFQGKRLIKEINEGEGLTYQHI
ncbi:MAG: N-acetylneuraminate synthase family protein [Cyclobacteriaceae bacterium]